MTVIVREFNYDSEAFATPRLVKLNAGRTGKDWHGLRAITTTLAGVPERELDHLLSDWREARPEERQAAVAAMRLASYQGCLDAGRKRFQGTDDEIVHQERQGRGKLGKLTEQIELQAKLLNYFLGSNKSNINQSAGRKSGFEGSDDQIRTLQAFKNLLTAARRGGKIDMSLPEPQIRSLQTQENILTAARNAGKIDMSLPEPQIQSLQAEANLLTAARNGGKIDMSLSEPKIRGLQAKANLITAARIAGKINMSLSEPKIQGLQAEENILTAARRRREATSIWTIPKQRSDTKP